MPCGLPSVFLYESMPADSRFFPCLKRWSILLLSFLTLYNFILLANISYQKLEIAYEKSFGTVIRLADRIEQLPEAAACDKIAVFGSLADSESIAVYFPPNMTGITDGYILRKQDTSMGENVPQAMVGGRKKVISYFCRNGMASVMPFPPSSVHSAG